MKTVEKNVVQYLKQMLLLAEQRQVLSDGSLDPYHVGRVVAYRDAISVIDIDELDDIQNERKESNQQDFCTNK